MKKLLLFLLAFMFSSFQAFSQITQGQVLINSFDPRSPNYYNEFVVLVNNTASPIDLNGYELEAFQVDGTTASGFTYQWTSSYIMPAYGFLLITNNMSSVAGLTPDIELSLGGGTSGGIDNAGYLTFRKTGASSSSDYIDIVKFERSCVGLYKYNIPEGYRKR